MELLEPEKEQPHNDSAVVVVVGIVAAAGTVGVAEAYYSPLAPEAPPDAALKVGECHCSLEEAETNLLQEDIGPEMVVVEDISVEKVVVQKGCFVG